MTCAFALPLTGLIGGAEGGLGGAAFIGFFTVVGTLVIGAPIFLWFRTNGWLQLWQFAIGGASIGTLASLVFFTEGWRVGALFAVMFGVLGAIHACVFWFIGVFKNQALVRTSRSGDRDVIAT